MTSDQYLSANVRTALNRAQIVLAVMSDDERSVLGLHLRDAVDHLSAAFKLLEER